MILGITGHRPNKLGGYSIPNRFYNSVCEGLDRLLLEYRPEKVITGMAMGVDQWMAELCIWNGVPFVAAIPFEGFEDKWYEATQRKYRQLMAHASETVLVCTGGFEGWKMQRRNEWVVNNCHVLGAVFDGTFGGTSNCIRYARDVAKPIRYVDFLRPPPLVSNERPRVAAPVIITPDPVVLPRRETGRERLARQRAERETEGQLAARRAAAAQAARETAEQAEADRRRQRVRRGRTLTITEAEVTQMVAEVEAAVEASFTQAAANRSRSADAEPVKEEPKATALEFARFVDLDV